MKSALSCSASSTRPWSSAYIARVAPQPALAGELPGESEPRLSLTDSGFEWEKTYEYHAEAVTIITEPNKPEVQLEGDDSPAVKVFADDVFPPAVPSG